MFWRSVVFSGLIVLAGCSGPSSKTTNEGEAPAARQSAPSPDPNLAGDSQLVSRTPTGLEGTISFNYSGTLTSSSTFSASGPLPGSIEGQATLEWAAGTRDLDAEKSADPESAPIATVVGSRPATPGHYDFAVLALARVSKGLAPIDTGGCYGNCPGLVVYFRTTDAPNTPGQIACTVVKGVIRVDSISPVRAVGTFSGTGGCMDDEANSSPFAVTNGAFNVALVSPDRFGTVSLSR